MNKVLVGVGIGCGAIVVIGVVAVVAGGIWAKGKLEDVAQEMNQGGEKMQSLEQRVAEMNQRYSFAAPPKGQPLRLTEERLQEYLAVRASLKPVLDDFQVKAKNFAPPKGEQPNLGKSIQALGMMTNLRADLSAKWLDALDERKMSPREFHAITAAVYTSEWSKAKGELPKHQRTMLEQLRSGYQKQAEDSSLTEDKREWARQQIADVDRKLSALPAANTPPPESQKVYEANAALAQKYKKKIEEASSAGLDVLLVGNGSELGTALQDALGGDAQDPSVEQVEPPMEEEE
ncbi:hypothetical protein [Hyalangium gracile]|uniref:hypothetical protein n=1 Tax=Hyalangium gracile TaxID=394092 RepID=UPI001CCAD5DC|nr:hypothetical protein [Hyalangium gracile]